MTFIDSSRSHQIASSRLISISEHKQRLHFVGKSCSNMVHKHLKNMFKTKCQGKFPRDSVFLEL